MSRISSPAFPGHVFQIRLHHLHHKFLVLLAPSDHIIGDTGAFLRAIETGLAAAEAGALVTLGIQPDRPHTGYGYINGTPAQARSSRSSASWRSLR